MVYKAQDTRSGEDVAVKLITAPHAEGGLKQRIQREMDILTRLAHPNIVQCFDAGTLPDGRLYLVLEWLEGEDLSDFKLRAPMGLRRVLELLEQVGDALELAHRHGIIHRDVKPANIFLMRPEVGAPLECRVLDFGVAKIPQSDVALTHAGAILGTPSYMAPEQANQATEVDGRADLFSLGVVAFELLAGRMPWESPTDLARLARILVERALPLKNLLPEVPDPVAELVDSMLEIDLPRRMDAAAAVRDIARGCLDALPAEALDRSYGRPQPAIAQLVRAETVDAPRLEPVVAPPPRLAPRWEDAKGAFKEVSVVTDAAAQDDSEHNDFTQLLDAISIPTPVLLARSDARLPVEELPNVAWAEADATEALNALSSAEIAAYQPTKKGAARFDEWLSYVEHRPGTMLFGRVAELERLRARALMPLTTSRPSYTVVVGPAGIGKTHVRSELLRMVCAIPKPPRVLSGRAEEPLRTTPFALLRRLLLAELNLQGDEPGEVQREKLLRLLPGADEVARLTAEVERRFARAEPPREITGEGPTRFFSGPLPAPPGAPSRAGPPPEEERAVLAAFAAEALRIPYPELPAVVSARRQPSTFAERQQRALEVILRAMAEREGLIVLVDDAHFLDAPSAAVLRRLVEPGRSLPVALVAFGLVHFLERDTRDASPLADVESLGAELMDLLPLEPRAGRELVRSLVRGEVESSSLETLVRKAAGNPLYLEQLVRALQASGDLDLDERGEHVLSADGHGELVPPTVAAAVSARISRMEPKLQKLLTAASVFGEVFWAEGVAALAELDLEEVTIGLDRLLLEHVVRRRSSSRHPRQTELEFTHAAIRSVALSRLKRRRRRQFEGAAVTWLEKAGEGDPAVLARHVGRSGEHGRASELYADAAERCLGLGDLVSAAVLADEGLHLEEGPAEVAARPRLLELAERIALARGDVEAAREALEQLGGLLTEPKALASLVERRARVAFVAGRFEEARSEAEAARRAFEALGQKEAVARAELAAAEASEELGEVRAALRGYLGAQAVLGAKNGPAQGAAARGLARIAIASGDYRSAENRFRGALVFGRTQRDQRAIFLAELGLAEVARLIGEPIRAREYLEEAERAAASSEERLEVEVHRAQLLIEERRFEDASHRLQLLVEEAEGLGAGAAHRRAALALARLPPRLGSPSARARVSLGEALESARSEEPALAPVLELALAWAEAERGDEAAARERAARALECFTREGALRGEEPPAFLHAHARVLERLGGAPAEVQRGMRAAVTQLDTISSRLERKSRHRYLDRWMARGLIEDASRVGLALSRDVSSNRIAIDRG